MLPRGEQCVCVCVCVCVCEMWLFYVSFITGQDRCVYM